MLYGFSVTTVDDYCNLVREQNDWFVLNVLILAIGCMYGITPKANLHIVLERRVFKHGDILTLKYNMSGSDIRELENY